VSPPYGYLIGLAVFVVPALPVRLLPRRLGLPVFFLSISVNELPFLAVLAFAGSTALAASGGDLGSPVTAAAVVLAAACLTLTTWRSLRTPAVLQRAMGPIAVSPRLPYLRMLLRPFPLRPRSVERVANLAYGPFGRRNLLDLYRHRSHPAGAPVLIHFHGGHFRSGRKNAQSLPLLHRLAEQGWVCVSATYRLQPDAGFEDHLADAKRVVAWVRAHGRDWGADPDRIVVAGSSAGAHLASTAALTFDDPALQPGFEDADTSVSAVVGLGGYYGPYDGRTPRTSPAGHARADAPPFLIVHGGNDSLIPAADARRFAERLRAVAAQPVVYAELPGGHHGFDLYHSPRFEAVANAVEAFAAAATTDRARA
jgi:acetyl esterase/lipase